MDSIFVYRAPEACDPSAGPSDGRTLDGASAAGTAPTDAASTDARPAPEPPADLRVALQPNLSVRGWPTNAGSTALAGYSALEDATLARRLRESGARLCGYTGMSEFGLGLDGSSAGLVFLHQAADAELVLDLLGEGRLAAARAGVFGFKPSYGLLSRFGLVGLIPSMECCAVLAPNLSSIRRILEAIAGPDDLDYSLPSEELPRFSSPDRQISSQARPPISIGVVREATESLSSKAAAAFSTTMAGLAQAGVGVHEVHELSLPEWSLFSPIHEIVGSVEASSSCGRYDSVRYGPRAPGAKNWNEMYLLSRGAAFGTLVKSYLMQGAFFQFEHYHAFEDACRIRARLVRAMEKITQQVDFLVLPLAEAEVAGDAAHATAATAPAATMEADTDTTSAATGVTTTAGDKEANPLTGLYDQFASTLFANITGQPVLFVPASAKSGRPAGIQLTGARLSDARLLAFGESLGTARGGE